MNTNKNTIVRVILEVAFNGTPDAALVALNIAGDVNGENKGADKVSKR